MESFLLEIDLAQVESRIVYMLTGDPELVREAQLPPWKHDMHTENARLIYGVQDITPKQRYLGKKGVHGAQRGMMGKTLAENLLKEGEVMTPDECQWIIDKYFASKPAIKEVYFREVREKIWADRKLMNSWGREAFWPYARFEESLYRELYSWQPQSDAADLLNRQGLIPSYEFIESQSLLTKLLAQIHDSVLFNTNIQEAYKIAENFKECIERPIIYPAGPLSVPISVKIGRTWAGYHEYKKFPEEDEFNAKIEEMLRNELNEGDLC